MDDKRKAALLVLREYPAMKRGAAELRTELERPRRSKSKRPTEDTAVRLSDDPRLRAWEAKCAAVERLLDTLSDEDRKLIELVYWRATHSITGASMLLYLSPATAYRRMSAILGSLERELERSADAAKNENF